MEKLFGIPMQNIMYVMLTLLAICLLAVVWIAIRKPVIFKLGIRNIPRRKSQTTLIIVGLMLATLIISAALATGDTLNGSVKQAVLDMSGPVDEVVMPSQDPNGKVELQSIMSQTMPEQDAAKVKDAAAGNDKIAATGPILYSIAPVLNLGQEDPASITGFEQATGKASASNPSVGVSGFSQESLTAFGGMKTTDGQDVDLGSLGKNEIYITEKLSKDIDIKQGDTLGYAVNNTFYSAKVKGVVPDTLLAGSIGQENPGGMMMPLDRLQEQTGHKGKVSAILVSNSKDVEQGLKRADDVTPALRETLKTQGLGVADAKKDAVKQAEMLGNVFTTMFIVFGLFSIGVGILLIVLIFTMLAAERRAEMGMERAVGAQRGQLIQQFIAEGAGYTILSGLAGTALGVLTSWLIVVGFQQMLGDYFDVNLHVTPRSLVIAYSLGVVITFLAVVLSSWRVSKLNVVSAIRDIPEVYRAKKNRKQLIWSIVGMVAGALLLLLGYQTGTAATFSIGVSAFLFSLAALSSYFGASSRIMLSLASILTLMYWLTPIDWSNDVLGKEMKGSMEMFFVSGICIVAAATFLIMQNLDLLLKLVSSAGGALKGWLPATRLAIAYPGQNKSRAGMAIAMFSLIVFSLVMIAAITKNFDSVFLGDNANAGMHVSVAVPAANPTDDFNKSIADAGVDPNQVQAVGQQVSLPESMNSMQKMDGDWTTQISNSVDPIYLDNANLTFAARADGYSDDAAVRNALKTQKNVVVVPSWFAEDVQGGFGGSGAKVKGVKSEGTFAPAKMVVRGNQGDSVELTVIGVIDTKISSIFAPIVSWPTFQNAPEAKKSHDINYILKLKDGGNAKDVAAKLEKSLLPHGAQGIDLKQQMKDSQKQQQTFMYILQGFMGLGMIVGVAAVGVIAYRAVVERRQQIGMLRALGFQRSEVARSFVIESGITVVLGVITGAIFGLILAYQIMTDDGMGSGGTVSEFIVPWETVIVTIAVAIIAALLMTWLPASQASKIAPAEALRYE